MASNQNPFRINGLGILKGYLNDADYLTLTGSSVKRGDVYFETTRQLFRYYTGTDWADLTHRNNRAIVRLFDDSTLATPSGNQTIDSILTSAGDLVLLSVHSTDPGIYRVEAGLWTLVSELTQVNGIFTTGDSVYVITGSIYGGSTRIYDGVAWVSSGIPVGTVTSSTLRWNGAAWVENATVLTNTYSIFSVEDIVVDSNPAGNLSITASEKTAGTGDGGDLIVQGGASAGGNKGSVVLSGYTAQIQAIHAADPITGAAGWLYYNSVINAFKYHDGSSWQNLGESGFTSAPLNDNQAAPAVIFSLVALGNENIKLDFSVKRGTNKMTGTLFISNNTVDVSIAESFVQIGDAGVTFDADINAGNVRLLYTSTNTGTAPSMKYRRTTWAD